MRRFSFLLTAGLCLVLSGCTASQVPDAVSINLSDLTSAPTLVLLVLTYLMDSKGQFAAVAKTIKAVLQKIGFFKDVTPSQEATAKELADLIVDLMGRLNGQPELQAKVMPLLTEVSQRVAQEAASVSQRR